MRTRLIAIVTIAAAAWALTGCASNDSADALVSIGSGLEGWPRSGISR